MYIGLRHGNNYVFLKITRSVGNEIFGLIVNFQITISDFIVALSFLNSFYSFLLLSSNFRITVQLSIGRQVGLKEHMLCLQGKLMIFHGFVKYFMNFS